MSQLNGKVAMITGGAGGIGSATVARLSAEGADVVIADLDGAGARALAEKLADEGHSAIGVEVDMADEGSIVALIAAAVERFGGLDILHNNAAALATEQHHADGDVTEMDVATWDLAMNVNARGTMLACKHAIPVMLQAGGGSIINMASIAALRGMRVRLAYGCSKAAVVALTQYVATCYGKRGIRCNSIAPGNVVHEGHLKRRLQTEVDTMLRHYQSPRAGIPNDIASLVSYLSSDESAFINGHTFVVDGGMTIHMPNIDDVGPQPDRST